MEGVKKRPFLLLELTIALVLMAAIVTILMSSYKELTFAKLALDEDRAVVLQKQRLTLRLEQVLAKIVTWRAVEPNRYAFTFNNGPDLEPSFRGEVEAMLYLDRDQLCMITWPNGNELPRIEVLANRVKNVSFAFFDTETGIFENYLPKEQPFMAKCIINKEAIAFFL
jgi:hypothetical protein